MIRIALAAALLCLPPLVCLTPLAVRAADAPTPGPTSEPVTTDPQPPVMGQQPQAGGEQPAAGGEQPASPPAASDAATPPDIVAPK